MPNDKSEKEGKPLFDDALDACDPTNFEKFETEEIIRAI